MASELKFEIIEDFGSFGDGNWQKRLTLTRWGDNEAKYDIRPWSADMSKCGKGITLTLEEIIDLRDLMDDIINE